MQRWLKYLNPYYPCEICGFWLPALAWHSLHYWEHLESEPTDGSSLLTYPYQKNQQAFVVSIHLNKYLCNNFNKMIVLFSRSEASWPLNWDKLFNSIFMCCTRSFPFTILPPIPVQFPMFFFQTWNFDLLFASTPLFSDVQNNYVCIPVCPGTSSLVWCHSVIVSSSFLLSPVPELGQ